MVDKNYERYLSISGEGISSKALYVEILLAVCPGRSMLSLICMITVEKTLKGSKQLFLKHHVTL